MQKYMCKTMQIYATLYAYISKIICYAIAVRLFET